MAGRPYRSPISALSSCETRLAEAVVATSTLNTSVLASLLVIVIRTRVQRGILAHESNDFLPQQRAQPVFSRAGLEKRANQKREEKHSVPALSVENRRQRYVST